MTYDVLMGLQSDLTKLEEVIKIHDEICATLPPLGGIAQGASE